MVIWLALPGCSLWAMDCRKRIRDIVPNNDTIVHYFTVVMEKNPEHRRALRKRKLEQKRIEKRKLMKKDVESSKRDIDS